MKENYHRLRNKYYNKKMSDVLIMLMFQETVRIAVASQIIFGKDTRLAIYGIVESAYSVISLILYLSLYLIFPFCKICENRKNKIYRAIMLLTILITMILTIGGIILISTTNRNEFGKGWYETALTIILICYQTFYVVMIYWYRKQIKVMEEGESAHLVE